MLDTDVEVSPLPSPVLLGDRKRKDSPAVIDDEERINEDSENIKRRRESSTPVVEEEEEQEVERKLKLKVIKLWIVFQCLFHCFLLFREKQL